MVGFFKAVGEGMTNLAELVGALFMFVFGVAAWLLCVALLIKGVVFAYGLLS